MFQLVGAEQPTKKSDRELVQDAEYVLRLSNDEAFRAIFGTAEKEIERDWKAGQTAEVREGSWQQLQGLRRVERQMQVTIERGQMAQTRIDKARGVGRTT